MRSSADGHLLARVVEREGTAFVLDYGDPRVVAEASRLVHHGGFKVWWQGREETAVAGSPAVIRQLALHFAAQGLLVFLDEPDFPRRALPAPMDVPFHDHGPPTLYPDDPSGHDMDTEILSRDDLARREARRFHQATTEEVDLEDPPEAMVEWEETEEVPIPPRRPG